MDNDRPSLDAIYLNAVCPDKNGTYHPCPWLSVFDNRFHMHSTVPVIAVFTKYDDFKLTIGIDMEDKDPTDVDAEVERVFKEQYLTLVEGAWKHVRLESESLITILFFILPIMYQTCTRMANAVMTLSRRQLMFCRMIQSL